MLVKTFGPMVDKESACGVGVCRRSYRDSTLQCVASGKWRGVACLSCVCVRILMYYIERCACVW